MRNKELLNPYNYSKVAYILELVISSEPFAYIIRIGINAAVNTNEIEKALSLALNNYIPPIVCSSLFLTIETNLQNASSQAYIFISRIPSTLSETNF